MTIYAKTKSATKRRTDYRRIFEKYHGPIPKEPNGRTYEIHHIDGDHKNNDPANLTAITLQEHYDIHYSQEDWDACRLMKLQRMDKTPEEISDLARKGANQRVENGTHQWTDSEWQRENQLTRVKNGSHNWTKRDDGSSAGSDLSKKRVADGTHHLLGPDINQARIDNQSHNWLGSTQNEKMLADGNHPSQVKWTCEGCGKSGKGTTNFNRWHSKESATSCWNKS